MNKSILSDFKNELKDKTIAIIKKNNNEEIDCNILENSNHIYIFEKNINKFKEIKSNIINENKISIYNLDIFDKFFENIKYLKKKKIDALNIECDYDEIFSIKKLLLDNNIKIIFGKILNFHVKEKSDKIYDLFNINGFICKEFVFCEENLKFCFKKNNFIINSEKRKKIFNIDHKNGISLCVISLNEEKYLERLLKNIDGCFDEVVVLDGGSVDNTEELCIRNKCKFYFNKFNYDFALQRNICISKSKFSHIFVLDCDELISEFLKNKIIQKKYFLNNDVIIFRIVQIITKKFKNHFNEDIVNNINLYNKINSLEYYHFRLFERDNKYIGKIHESLDNIKSAELFDENGYIIHLKDEEKVKNRELYYYIISPWNYADRYEKDDKIKRIINDNGGKEEYIKKINSVFIKEIYKKYYS